MHITSADLDGVWLDPDREQMYLIMYWGFDCFTIDSGSTFGRVPSNGKAVIEIINHAELVKIGEWD